MRKNQPDLESDGRQVAERCGMQGRWRRLKMGGVEVINENKFSKLSGTPSWKAFMLHQKLHVEDFFLRSSDLQSALRRLKEAAYQPY